MLGPGSFINVHNAQIPSTLTLSSSRVRFGLALLGGLLGGEWTSPIAACGGGVCDSKGGGSCNTDILGAPARDTAISLLAESNKYVNLF